MVMHVAILGAGALGRVYGLRLENANDVRVSFVVKKDHVAEPFQIEKVDSGESHVLETPARVHEVPHDADIILVCVRAEQLADEALAHLQAPTVLLTPLMPADYARLEAALGDKLVAGMPSTVAYTAESGSVRYWLPRVATTLLEDARSHAKLLERLEKALDSVGIETRREEGVQQINAATTITFLPITMALAAAGGVTELLADDPLTELGLRAAEESTAIAETIGKSAPWAPLLVKFLGPSVLKMGVAIAEKSAPEAVHYVDEHFGKKLRRQAQVMGQKLADLAAAKKLPHEAIDALNERLT
jgi:2-dehydropantoate 2-reductase